MDVNVKQILFRDIYFIKITREPFDSWGEERGNSGKGSR